MIPVRRRDENLLSDDEANAIEAAELEFTRVEREAEGFNTFVVMDTLVFGFGVASWFEFDETLFEDEPYLLIFFSLFLAITIISTGFGAAVMAALHVASMKVLSKRSAEHITKLFDITQKIKDAASAATYLSFLCLYFVLAIYGYVKMVNVGKNNNGSVSATIAIIIGIIVFVIGFIGVLYGIFSLRPKIKAIVIQAANEYQQTLQKVGSKRSNEIPDHKE